MKKNTNNLIHLFHVKQSRAFFYVVFSLLFHLAFAFLIFTIFKSEQETAPEVSDINLQTSIPVVINYTSPSLPNNEDIVQEESPTLKRKKVIEIEKNVEEEEKEEEIEEVEEEVEEEQDDERDENSQEVHTSIDDAPEENNDELIEEQVDVAVEEVQDDDITSQVEEYIPFYKIDEKPVFLQRSSLVYPPNELKRRNEGSVVVEVDIDSKGNVRGIRVVKSAGKNFDVAAVDMIQASTFTPGYIGRRPVATRMKFTVKFKISDH